MAEHSIPSIDLGDSDCSVSPVLEQALTNQLNYRTGLYRYAEPM